MELSLFSSQVPHCSFLRQQRAGSSPNHTKSRDPATPAPAEQHSGGGRCSWVLCPATVSRYEQQPTDQSA